MILFNNKSELVFNLQLISITHNLPCTLLKIKLLLKQFIMSYKITCKEIIMYKITFKNILGSVK